MSDLSKQDTAQDAVTDEMKAAGAKAFVGVEDQHTYTVAEHVYLSMRPLDPYVVALERDARRYRWPRNNATEHCDNQQPYIAVHVQNDWGKWREKLYEGEELDAAIDQARGESDGQG